jgi:acetoin utilization protein AcuB
MLPDLSTTRVRDWMIASVPVITPQTTIATALRLLREHDLPALPVCAGARLLGLVDEKALLRLTPSEATTLDVYELRAALDSMTVARVATPPPAPVTPDASLDAVALLMLEAGAPVIPVLDGGRLVGLIGWSSLLAAAVGAPHDRPLDGAIAAKAG